MAAVVLSVFAWGSAVADPLGTDGEDVPATAGELRFLEMVVKRVEASLPVPAGWKREAEVVVSGYPVLEGEPVRIFYRAWKGPLRIHLLFWFSKITETERKQAAARKNAEELQQEMIAAAMRGDTARVEELQQQLGALVRSQVLEGPMGQAAGAAPSRPTESPSRFSVNVVVNGQGQTIGKKYEVAVPGVLKAFRVAGGKEGQAYRTYYLGRWDVSSRQSNWKVQAFRGDYVPANHLKVMTISLELAGEEAVVDRYARDLLDLGGIRSLLD
ncbi:hypothetical protein [Deferrisoma camini]|uniref:hypothetical protein n=1 Tax=Deferrisoma camini TaxID=1035120 RepID=UPI00146A4408|nr:hypothetical protein [Deferrisoma camini]